MTELCNYGSGYYLIRASNYGVSLLIVETGNTYACTNLSFTSTLGDFIIKLNNHCWIWGWAIIIHVKSTVSDILQIVFLNCVLQEPPNTTKFLNHGLTFWQQQLYSYWGCFACSMHDCLEYVIGLIHVVYCIPPNSHALCMSHTPADWKQRSHAYGTISYTWLTILDYLFIKH